MTRFPVGRRILALLLALLLGSVVLPFVFPTAAKESAALSPEQAEGHAGDEVVLPLRITQNPGIAAFRFRIAFDSSALTLTALEKGEILTEGTFRFKQEESSAGNVTVLWFHTEDVSEDGVLMNLRFRITEDAAENIYPVSFTWEADDISNAQLQSVPVTAQQGAVTVIAEPPDSVPGDLNEDDGVDADDVYYLLQHTFDSEAYPINQSCDFNKDGEVDADDVYYLLQSTFDPDSYPLN